MSNSNKDKRDKKLIELKNLVEAAEISLQQARKIINNLVDPEEEKMLAEQARNKSLSGQAQEDEGQVIMGVFDGQNMVGANGKKYSVPANYASKSKLVEGDELKLTITPDGSFVYKQIHLLDRERLIGELILDEETNEFRVLANGKSYKVLNASITYFKGEPGDKVALLVPKGKESSWAAVENIIKVGQDVQADKESANFEKKQATAQTTETNEQAGFEETENNKNLEAKEDFINKDEEEKNDADLLTKESVLKLDEIMKNNKSESEGENKEWTEEKSAEDEMETEEKQAIEESNEQNQATNPNEVEPSEFLADHEEKLNETAAGEIDENLNTQLEQQWSAKESDLSNSAAPAISGNNEDKDNYDNQGLEDI